MNLPIRSNSGNRLLLILGAAIAIASAALLIYAAVILRDTRGIINLALYLFLFFATASGALIARLAASTLSGKHPRLEPQEARSISGNGESNAHAG
jgi:uncharacterized membrane protein (UPF0182 family)